MTEVTKIADSARRLASIKLTRDIATKPKRCSFPESAERVIFNYSSYNLNKYEREVLSLGPKFCILKPKVNDKDEILLQAANESLFADLSKCNKSEVYNEAAVKAELGSAFTQYKKATKTNQLITKKHLEAIKQLRQNKDIRIMKPDKGSGIVIMNTKQYNEQVETILADETKFRHLDNQKDNTAKTEANITNIINAIKKSVRKNSDEPTTDEQQLLKLLEQAKPSGTNIPRLFGSPKVHKVTEDVPVPPVRPVLSMSNAPQHKPARMLHKLLEPIQQIISRHTVKDTNEFVDTIKDTNVSNDIMVSFDVTSLFTNVPLEKTVEYLCELITEELPTFPIPINQFKQLVYACTKDVQLIFNEKFYTQCGGISMGSPLASLLADTYMYKLETTGLKPIIDKASTYKRYVDDGFATIPKSENPEEILEYINSIDEHIKFTMEVEKDNTLPYLDVKLVRKNDGTLQRSVYRKHTWTGQYTHYLSSVPRSQKRNLITNLADRIRRICTPDTVDEELQTLQQCLTKNGYPKSFIAAHMKPKQQISTERKDDDKNKKLALLIIPFRGDLPAEILTRRIQRITTSNYKEVKLRVIFSTQKLLATNVKDKLADSSKSSIVYQYKCICSRLYIGRSTKRLETRVAQHLPQKLLTKGQAPAQKSAICEHILQSGCPANKENFSILFKTRSENMLLIIEALCIQKYKPELNIQKYHQHDLKLNWNKGHSNTRARHENTTQHQQPANGSQLPQDTTQHQQPPNVSQLTQDTEEHTQAVTNHTNENEQHSHQHVSNHHYNTRSKRSLQMTQ